MPSPDADGALRLRLEALWIYPIKSCGGYEVPSAQVSPRTGLIGDREWVMLTPGGRQAWMGEFHRMALIQARNDCDGLVLSAPGMDNFLVPFDSPGRDCMVKMWND
ncbi:MAG: MOSC domain-containing protein, partial [Alphaproteobacteria bacterium]